MRRWLIILLLFVYPFQLALAVADKCCATTSTGVTHHAVAAQPAFVAADGDDASMDPHCPACTFGHILYLPSGNIGMPAAPRATDGAVFIAPRLSAPPRVRLERPKWSSAAG